MLMPDIQYKVTFADPVAGKKAEEE